MDVVKVLQSDLSIGGNVLLNHQIQRRNVSVTGLYTLDQPIKLGTFQVVLDGIKLKTGQSLKIQAGNFTTVIAGEGDYATFQVDANVEEVTTLTIENLGTGEATIESLSVYPGEYVPDFKVLYPNYIQETKKANLAGWYIEAEFPLEHSQFVRQDYIIMAQTKSKGEQPFRITNPQVIDDVLQVTAYHVMFDMHNYVVRGADVVEATGMTALLTINRFTDPPSPFIFTGDVQGALTMNFTDMSMFDAVKAVLDNWGGKIEADGFNISVKNEFGSNKGIDLMYGNNLEGMRYFENFDNVCTKVYPRLDNGLSIDPIESKIQYSKQYVKSREFKLEIPDERKDDTEWQANMLKNMATAYLERAQFPLLSYQVQSNVPQDIQTWDLVRVFHPAISEDLSLKDSGEEDKLFVPIHVVGYVYDILDERVTQVDYGDYSSNTYSLFGDIVDRLEEQIRDNTISQNDKLEAQTELINSLNKNGHVVIENDVIYLLDSIPKETAQTVWILGNGGISVSETGINGNFVGAWDLKYGINANFITAGVLSADLIEAKSITSKHLSIDAIDLVVNLAREGGNNLIRNSVMASGMRYPWVGEGIADTLGMGSDFTSLEIMDQFPTLDVREPNTWRTDYGFFGGKEQKDEIGLIQVGPSGRPNLFGFEAIYYVDMTFRTLSVNENFVVRVDVPRGTKEDVAPLVNMVTGNNTSGTLDSTNAGVYRPNWKYYFGKDPVGAVAIDTYNYYYDIPISEAYYRSGNTVRFMFAVLGNLGMLAGAPESSNIPASANGLDFRIYCEREFTLNHFKPVYLKAHNE